MASGAGPGRLLAVESADGEQLAEAATILLDRVVRRGLTAGISRWDASGLFGDVATAPRVQRDVSPRSLLLLYAADLAFRLRWEISPVLQNGGVVIAAPYVTTAVTFGLATGLAREWLLTLFRFAPRPARTAVLRPPERARAWKRDPHRGFAECCTTLLESTPEGFARRKTRAAMVDALATAADQHGGVYRKRDVADLVDEVVRPRDRRAAPTPHPRRAR